MPWITHGGNTVADSSAIIQYLVNTYGEGKDSLGDLKIKLTAAQEAKSVAIGRVCDHLVAFGVYFRFVGEQRGSFYDLLLKGVPGFIAPVVGRMLSNNAYNSLHAQGVARLHNDEKLAQMKEDIDCLSELLGTGSFFLGDTISLADLLPFGLLENLLNDPFAYQGFKAYALAKPNIAAFLARIRAKYFTAEAK